MALKDRKSDHLRIALSEKVQFKKTTTWLEKVLLEYRALPEIDFEDVMLETEFLGKRMKAPLIVSAITGGIEEAKQINKDIAKACESLGIGMGLGSQRAMLENKNLKHTFFVRDVAPNIFLAGNIGITQLNEYSIEQLDEALDLVGADALAVHINAAQEAIQPDDSPQFRGGIKALAHTVKKLGRPVYAKEVGHGISHNIAKMLSGAKIKAIDVQGAGGTSWTAIESLRNNGFGGNFWDFGIPTASSIADCRKAFKGPIIASGGIRSGLDAVKAFVLGADLAGIALPVLQAQNKGGSKAVEEYLKGIIKEMQIGLFLLGARKPKEAQGRGRISP